MNNPVQKRFESLGLKWQEAINVPDVKIVRFYADHDEQPFIHDFFEYMLALDTDQEDLVFLLESPWDSIECFSKTLIEEVYDIVALWNTMQKPEGFPQEVIDWSINEDLGREENRAALFVDNVNILARTLVPDKDVIVSFIIKMPFAPISKANTWLQEAIEAGLESHVRIGIADTKTHPMFTPIAGLYPDKVYTIYPNIDIDGCAEEMAAIGAPNDPEVSYRSRLMKLLTAVSQRDEKLVDKLGKQCLAIASKNIQKDVNWLNQVVFVYTILYNDKIGYKAYKEALAFSDRAVANAALAIGRIEPATAYRLYGQTLIGRGAIESLLKKHEDACADYERAITCYQNCQDHIMQCESIRLYAVAAKKAGRGTSEILEHLITGFYLIDKMSPEYIKNSTYPWVVDLLLNYPEREQTLPDTVVDEKLIPHFGVNYRREIKRYGKIEYAQEAVYKN